MKIQLFFARHRILSRMALAAVSMSVGGCDEFNQATKQTPTFANMQTIAQELQRRVVKDGSVSEKEATEFMKEYNGGVDSWGSPFLFRCRTEPSFSFILVSTGGDGTLDVDDVDTYFQMTETDIVGDMSRAIVFRDGRHVTVASPQ